MTTTTALNADLRDWPELAQVVRVERERRVKGVVSVEVAYFSTSLDRGQADAARLLALIRRHWGIENKVHWVGDVSLGEDDRRVRTGSSPEVLAALRNTALQLLAGVRATSRAAASGGSPPTLTKHSTCSPANVNLDTALTDSQTRLVPPNGR